MINKKNFLKIEINNISKPFFIFSLLTIFFHFTLHPLKFFDQPTSIFYMDEAYTLASFFTTVTAFLVGVLFLLYSNVRSLTGKLIYQLTGMFFAALSFDELFSAHEYLSEVIKDAISYDTLVATPVNFSWILPLFIIVIAVVLLFIKLIKVENNIYARNAYILGLLSFIFVIIFEMIGGNFYGKWMYVVFVGIEEGFEMIGTAFFLLGITNKIKIGEL